MEKTRVRRGEPYWFVDIDGKVWDRYERNEVMDSILFSIGNYFHTKKEAEQMNKKFLAILKGADVIEMPSGEDLINMLPDADAYDELANGASIGWRECFKWIESKIVK